MLWRYHEHSRVPQVTREGIVEAARVALDLDPGLGIAYQKRLAELDTFNHFGEREALHERALANARSDPAVLAAAAMFLSEVGRLSEAVQLAEQAARIDPLFGSAESLHAGLLTGAGRHAEARVVCETLLAADPKSKTHIHNALFASAVAGDWRWFDAVVAHAKASQVFDNHNAEYVRFWTAIRVGDAAAKQQYLREIEREFEPGRLLQNDAIQNAVALGDVELAFSFAQRYVLELADDDRLPTTQFFGFALARCSCRTTRR